MPSKHLNTIALLLTLAAGTATPAALAQEATPEAPPAAPTPTTDEGRALIVASRERLNALTSISFNVTSRYEGTGSDRRANTASMVRMVKEHGNWTTRVTGEGKLSAASPESSFDAVYTPSNTVEWIDNTKKKLIERPANQAAATMLASGSRFADGFSARAFSSELGQATTFTMLDRSTVNGVECDVVEATLTSGQKSKWFIGVEDKLPRKLERSSKNNPTAIFEVSNLTSSSTSTPGATDALRLTPPEGYAVDRQGTPKPPAPTPEPAPETVKAVPVTEPDTRTESPSEPSPTPAATPTPTTPAQPTPTVLPPATLPPFTITTATGEAVTHETLRGKVAVIEFFGSWAILTKQWHPKLTDVLGKFNDPKVTPYAASVRERTTENAAECLRANNITFPHLLNAEQLAKLLTITAYPATAVIDPEGKIIGVVQGESDLDRAALKVESHIRVALGGTPIDIPEPQPAPAPAARPSEPQPLPTQPPNQMNSGKGNGVANPAQPNPSNPRVRNTPSKGVKPTPTQPSPRK
jgi:hypothetical protein